MTEEVIGTTGELVDLFNKELTQKEWDALCTIHRMSSRLNIGIRFDWSKSIDVRSEKTSQIIDESVFMGKETKTLDLDAMSKKFDELLEDPKTQDSIKEYFADIKQKGKIQNRQIKRFHAKYSKKLNWVVEKLEAKYSSDAYRDKEYKLGFEPRESLYWFLIEYARKYCKPCKNKKHWNMFTGEAYYIGSYVIQVMNGQGSVVKIEKIK